MSNQLFIAVILVIFVVLAAWYATGKCGSREHYRDPIFMNAKKFKKDYYPRANGSIYGTAEQASRDPHHQPWNMFSGITSATRAY